MDRFKFILITLIVLIAGRAIADTVTFYINDDKKRDIVTFTSKAPLETIVGKTSEIKGYIKVDPINITSDVKANFTVDLISLKTGIDLRDEHMRDNHLETNKYPEASFELENIISSSDSNLLENKTSLLTLEGDFSIHGVTKKTSAQALVAYVIENEDTQKRLPGDLLHVEVQFEIFLADFNIKRPQFLFLKLDEKIVVNVDIFASTKSPEVTIDK